MKKETILRLLKSQLHQIQSLKTKRTSSDFKKWYRDTQIVIEKIFGSTTRHLDDFNKVVFTPTIVTLTTTDADFQRAHEKGLELCSAVLSSMYKEVSDFGNEDSVSVTNNLNIKETLHKLCSRFHYVAMQLMNRKHNKLQYVIEDEYDVQDLFHALLKIEFDDIRPEEWTPSYAGGSSRIDFLLKNENAIVEIKKASNRHRQKQIGDELIIDIQRYKTYTGCKLFLCFIYDPNGFITNPRGLEKDLTKNTDDLVVEVLVRPN